jgi:hypothetical protein
MSHMVRTAKKPSYGSDGLCATSLFREWMDSRGPKEVHTISFEGAKILRKTTARGKNFGGAFLGSF